MKADALREVLERAHRTYCETTTKLGADTAPMIVVVYAELIIPISVPGDWREVILTLHELADPLSPIAARDVLGLIVHGLEVCDPAERVLVSSLLAQIVDGQPDISGIATEFYSDGNELGETFTLGGFYRAEGQVGSGQFRDVLVATLQACAGC